jgi:pimeloyl-ACP methyl ester carboxylesterase
VHGIGASHFCWRLVFRELTKIYRVTAIDLPGFGGSDKNVALSYDLDAQTKRLARIVEALELSPAYVLGCSMGGLLGLWLQKTRPDLVKGLAVIAPAAHKKIVFMNTKPLTTVVSLLGMTFVTPYTIHMIYRRITTKKDLGTAAVINEYFRPYAKDKSALICFWKAQEALRDTRLPEELSTISQPVLIMYGSKDLMVRQRHLQEMLRYLPSAKLVEHPTGGHHLMEDDPDFVTENIKGFFGATKAVT